MLDIFGGTRKVIGFICTGERFRFLRDEGVRTRVVHLIVDDRMAGKKSSEVMWHAETMQTRLGVQGVKNWMQGRVCNLDGGLYW